MKPFSEMGDAELAAALRSLRPEPSPAFAAELDQRAAAGFPRRSPQAARNPLARFFAWLRSGTRLRFLIPAGGVAVAAIAVATVMVVGSSTGGSSSSNPGEALGFLNGATLVEPESTGGTPDSAPLDKAAAAPPSASAAAGTAHRSIERTSQIVIGTEPDEVGDAASKVFEAIHTYDGIVLDSATQSGTGTEPEASFELLIPSGRLDDAMAAFSRVGEVVDRRETTGDITAPTINTSERLQDSRARIESLLGQLSEATTDAERESVEAELGAERRHAANLRTELSDLHRRANLARVSVRIVSGEGAVSRGDSDEDESWGLGTALDDAGHLLSVAAGVTIVALAVLAPLLLLLVLAWLAGRAWTRRARERALT